MASGKAKVSGKGSANIAPPRVNGGPKAYKEGPKPGSDAPHAGRKFGEFGKSDGKGMSGKATGT